MGWETSLDVPELATQDWGLSLQARQFYMTATKQLIQKEHTLKGSAFKCLEAVVAQLGEQHSEVEASGAVIAMEDFQKLLVTVNEGRNGTKTWNKNSFVDQFDQCMSVYDEAVQIARNMHGLVSTLKTVRLLQVRAFAGDRRKSALTVRRLLKPLVSQHFWKSLVTWFGEEAMGIAAESTTLKPQTCKALAVAGSAEVQRIPKISFCFAFLSGVWGPRNILFCRLTSSNVVGEKAEQRISV